MNISTIGILGHGQFGSFIAALSHKYFPNLIVKIHSSRREPDGTTFFSFEDTCASDLLVLTVPIAAYESTIQKIQPHLGDRTIVCDVATVKTHTVELLKQYGIKKYIATHPMFGPFSYEKKGSSLEGLRIALCESSLSEAETELVSKFLTEAGLIVLQMTPGEHDKRVAETLFLTHLIGQTVHRGGFERTAIDTVSFGYLMDAVESVAHDDVLFKDVYTYNPYCKDVLRRFENSQSAVQRSLTQ